LATNNVVVAVEKESGLLHAQAVREGRGDVLSGLYHWRYRMKSGNSSKKPESDFSRAESCMYHYLENLARIKALRDDLKIVDAMSSLKTQDYDARPGESGGFIDNIPIRIMKISALESLICGLERYTNPVARLIADLELPCSAPERQEMLEILRFRYFGGNTWARTEELLNMSHATLLERRAKLVHMAIGYMALDIGKSLKLKSDLFPT
jgi:hypothetical protein